MSKPKWFMEVYRRMGCACGLEGDISCGVLGCPPRWVFRVVSNLPKYQPLDTRWRADINYTGFPRDETLFVLDVDEYAHLGG